MTRIRDLKHLEWRDLVLVFVRRLIMKALAETRRNVLKITLFCHAWETWYDAFISFCLDSIIFLFNTASLESKGRVSRRNGYFRGITSNCSMENLCSSFSVYALKDVLPNQGLLYWHSFVLACLPFHQCDAIQALWIHSKLLFAQKLYSGQRYLICSSICRGILL